jgi:hypothetical protein
MHEPPPVMKIVLPVSFIGSIPQMMSDPAGSIGECCRTSAFRAVPYEHSPLGWNVHAMIRKTNSHHHESQHRSRYLRRQICKRGLHGQAVAMALTKTPSK